MTARAVGGGWLAAHVAAARVARACATPRSPACSFNPSCTVAVSWSLMLSSRHQGRTRGPYQAEQPTPVCARVNEQPTRADRLGLIRLSNQPNWSVRTADIADRQMRRAAEPQGKSGVSRPLRVTLRHYHGARTGKARRGEVARPCRDAWLLTPPRHVAPLAVRCSRRPQPNRTAPRARLALRKDPEGAPPGATPHERMHTTHCTPGGFGQIAGAR